MKSIVLLLSILLIPLFSYTQDIAGMQIFPVPTSIRALEVFNDSIIWYGGDKGHYGFSMDGGLSWTHDSITGPNNSKPEFRSLAVTQKAVYLLSVASPALLYRTLDNGTSWELVYKDDNPSVFYDAITFRDDDFGVAVGDPTEGCISVLITRDGGDHWQKIPCKSLPATIDNEGFFAASNSNVKIINNTIWLVSGGPVARVYISRDAGNTWEVVSSPIVQGSKMTGIFTMDFYNKNKGILFGGDWENMSSNHSNKAISNDGGKTWNLVSDGKDPGYRSCVRYIPDKNGQQIVAVGIPGISMSSNGGRSWNQLSKESFYTIRFTKNGKIAWLAGKGRLAKLKWK